ncbi:PREDICTED: nanos homolog 3 [Dufourea novaeangliae]|uniref:Nanos like protein 1 n=1 Tax=Dufourea novaeangliae TaxID=178035 RepID=A0A154P8L6_DUFNO|nr:PREDICTED: nanos homolog 3 [Dufourea novaeangliae]KZC07694.1 Nanos like protein 1 [Dufourea novaeangliae]
MHVSLMQQLLVPQVSNFYYPFNTSLEDELKRLFHFTIETQMPPLPNVEDVMEEFRHNGRDFEYCPDLDNDIVPETTPRRKKNKKPLPTECVFCRNNGEEETYYREHLLKDAEGRVSCPVLRAYTCPICGATGDEAHTIKYCTLSPKTVSGTLTTVNAFKLLRNSMGKRRVR